MASTYTSRLRLEKQGNGENDGTWGSRLSTVLDMLDDAIGGRAAVTHSDAADYTLTTANSATDEARNMIQNIAGTLTAARNVVVPTVSKFYVVKNATSGGFAITVKTSGGTGVSIANGKTAIVFCDGTNVVSALDYIAGTGTIACLDVENQALTGGVTVTSKDLGTVSSGTLTLDMGDRPLQNYTNNGAHTLAPGSVAGSCVLDITMGASAGTITTSGWTKVAGDAFTTTSGHKFRCSASVGNAGSLLQVQALQ